MQLKKIVVAALLLSAASSLDVMAQGYFDNPMKKAVMGTYQELLAKDPQDYAVYFRRANEYYNANQYLNALGDINAALKYAPQSEKDLRVQCYALRGAIHERMNMAPESAADFRDALALDPDNYTLNYQLANIEYAQGNYDKARESYRKLQRLNTRSQEALFGMARCAAKEGDKATASRLIDEAVELTPQSADSYYHRAGVRTLLGENREAVADYVMALKLSDDSDLTKPLRNLYELSNIDYDAVAEGLGAAIRREPRNGRLYFIRGVISQEHFRYAAAVDDFKDILDGNLLNFPGLYRRLAECQYALGRYDEAAVNIDYAIGSTADNIDAYVMKCYIKLALGHPTQGITAANQGLKQIPNYAPALLAKGIAEIDNLHKLEGSTDIGNASLAEPGDPYYKMVRAWALDEIAGDSAMAEKYYFDVLNLKGFAPDDVRSFRGFALLYTGNKEDGDAWMETVLRNARDSQDGEAEYFGACYYSASGDNARALECMAASLKKGYANYYNWTRNNIARINVEGLRSEPGFKELLDRYSPIFTPAR